MGSEPNPNIGPIRTEFELTHGRTFEPGFIATLLIRTGASMMLGSAIAAAGFLWLTPAATDQGYAASVLAFERLYETLVPLTLFFFILQFLVSGALLFLGGLLASHKIAGPLVRVERALNQLADGNLSVELAFRRGDQTGPLKQSFEALQGRIKQRLKTAAKCASRLKRLRDELGKVSRENLAPEEVERLIKEVEDEAEIMRVIGRFEQVIGEIESGV